MTREETAKCIKVMQAYANGEIIEEKIFSFDHTEWVESIDPTWQWYKFDYRIKPRPKYRPFKNAEECWQEMQKHQPFGYIYFADENLYHNIIMLAPEKGCNEAYIRIGNCTVRGLEEAFRISTFADGTPFGIREC